MLVARRPELWLLDEPHAGLDAEGRDRLDGLVRRRSTAGATVVLASHELERSVTLADRRSWPSGGASSGREPPARSTSASPLAESPAASTPAGVGC